MLIQSRAINATSRDFYGFTSAMSFAKLVLTFSTVTDLPQNYEKRLPTRVMATKMVQHYLDNIYILYPFLLETSIFTSLENVYQQDGRNATDKDHFLLRIILAISHASLSRSRNDLNHTASINYISTAIEYADGVLFPGSLDGIQASLLLVLYAMLDPDHFDSWYLIGVAVRILVDLGWHRDPPKQYSKDARRLDLRRRIYYCVYSLDRLVFL
jgi:hypothetical protein